jgi:hypothetical protein
MGPVLARTAAGIHLPNPIEEAKNMFNWLRRRRLSAGARKRMLLVQARAEEAIVETHVSNIIDLLVSLGEEVDLDRGIDLYVEMMSLDETLTATVTNRLLARFEDPTARLPRGARRFQDVFRDNG